MKIRCKFTSESDKILILICHCFQEEVIAESDVFEWSSKAVHKIKPGRGGVRCSAWEGVRLIVYLALSDQI
jgi:hypothetical protein